MIKKLFISILICSMGIVLASCTTDSPAPPAGDSNQSQEDEVEIDTGDYINDQENLILRNPNQWEKVENKYGTLVAFVSPLEDETDLFRENVNLVVEELPETIKLEEYKTAAHEQMDTVLLQFKLLSEEEIEFMGEKAYTHRYSFNQGEYDTVGMQIYYIKEQKAYILTYTAQPDKYDIFYDQAMEIINSLQIN
jgi:serine/threonine-protein kinase